MSDSSVLSIGSCSLVLDIEIPPSVVDVPVFSSLNVTDGANEHVEDTLIGAAFSLIFVMRFAYI